MDGAIASTVDEAPFTLIPQIVTETGTSADDIYRNYLANRKKPLPWTHHLPEFNKKKGLDKKIALVAGGPSVADYVEDIKQFRTIMICGSSNDWAMKNGIKPTYAVICDPDPISINYFQELDTETKYLISTTCDEKIFKHLEGQQVVLWTCHSEEVVERLKKDDLWSEGYTGVLGGCTVGMRAISLALNFGYNNIHMFGFDSCLGDNDKHHAYEFSDESEQVGGIYQIKVGSKAGLEVGAKTFRCTGYQLAQAENFRDFLNAFREFFNPIIYGNGLLAAVLENENKALKEITELESKS